MKGHVLFTTTDIGSEYWIGYLGLLSALDGFLGLYTRQECLAVYGCEAAQLAAWFISLCMVRSKAYALKRHACPPHTEARDILHPELCASNKSYLSTELRVASDIHEEVKAPYLLLKVSTGC